jgi:hypothetical protein
VIGRSVECDVRLDDSGASRRHGEIRRLPDGHFLYVDGGSTNGTLVNGQAATQIKLSDGDQIEIGSAVVTFRTGTREPPSVDGWPIPAWPNRPLPPLPITPSASVAPAAPAASNLDEHATVLSPRPDADEVKDQVRDEKYQEDQDRENHQNGHENEIEDQDDARNGYEHVADGPGRWDEDAEDVAAADAWPVAVSRSPVRPYTTAGAAAERRFRIFLCHSSDDKAAVRALYQELREAGFFPWLDEVDLLPGQNWATEIQRAIRSSRMVLACLSTTSVSKAGFVQKEIVYALDAAEEWPDGSIFIIPARLEPCEIPQRLKDLHAADLFSPSGMETLLSVLRFTIS